MVHLFTRILPSSLYLIISSTTIILSLLFFLVGTNTNNNNNNNFVNAQGSTISITDCPGGSRSLRNMNPVPDDIVFSSSLSGCDTIYFQNCSVVNNRIRFENLENIGKIIVQNIECKNDNVNRGSCIEFGSLTNIGYLAVHNVQDVLTTKFTAFNDRAGDIVLNTVLFAGPITDVYERVDIAAIVVNNFEVDYTNPASESNSVTISAIRFKEDVVARAPIDPYFIHQQNQTQRVAFPHFFMRSCGVLRFDRIRSKEIKISTVQFDKDVKNFFRVDFWGNRIDKELPETPINASAGRVDITVLNFLNGSIIGAFGQLYASSRSELFKYYAGRSPSDYPVPIQGSMSPTLQISESSILNLRTVASQTGTFISIFKRQEGNDDETSSSDTSPPSSIISDFKDVIIKDHTINIATDFATDTSISSSTVNSVVEVIFFDLPHNSISGVTNRDCFKSDFTFQSLSLIDLQFYSVADETPSIVSFLRAGSVRGFSSSSFVDISLDTSRANPANDNNKMKFDAPWLTVSAIWITSSVLQGSNPILEYLFDGSAAKSDAEEATLLFQSIRLSAFRTSSALAGRGFVSILRADAGITGFNKYNFTNFTVSHVNLDKRSNADGFEAIINFMNVSRNMVGGRLLLDSSTGQILTSSGRMYVSPGHLSISQMNAESIFIGASVDRAVFSIYHHNLDGAPTNFKSVSITDFDVVDIETRKPGDFLKDRVNYTFEGLGGFIWLVKFEHGFDGVDYPDAWYVAVTSFTFARIHVRDTLQGSGSETGLVLFELLAAPLRGFSQYYFRDLFITNAAITPSGGALTTRVNFLDFPHDGSLRFPFDEDAPEDFLPPLPAQSLLSIKNLVLDTLQFRGNQINVGSFPGKDNENFDLKNFDQLLFEDIVYKDLDLSTGPSKVILDVIGFGNALYRGSNRENSKILMRNLTLTNFDGSGNFRYHEVFLFKTSVKDKETPTIINKFDEFIFRDVGIRNFKYHHGVTAPKTAHTSLNMIRLSGSWTIGRTNVPMNQRKSRIEFSNVFYNDITHIEDDEGTFFVFGLRFDSNDQVSDIRANHIIFRNFSSRNVNMISNNIVSNYSASNRMEFSLLSFDTMPRSMSSSPSDLDIDQFSKNTFTIEDISLDGFVYNHTKQTPGDWARFKLVMVDQQRNRIEHGQINFNRISFSGLVIGHMKNRPPLDVHTLDFASSRPLQSPFVPVRFHPAIFSCNEISLRNVTISIGEIGGETSTADKERPSVNALVTPQFSKISRITFSNILLDDINVRAGYRSEPHVLGVLLPKQIQGPTVQEFDDHPEDLDPPSLTVENVLCSRIFIDRAQPRNPAELKCVMLLNNAHLLRLSHVKFRNITLSDSMAVGSETVDPGTDKIRDVYLPSAVALKFVGPDTNFEGRPARWMLTQQQQSSPSTGGAGSGGAMFEVNGVTIERVQLVQRAKIQKQDQQLGTNPFPSMSITGIFSEALFSRFAHVTFINSVARGNTISTQSDLPGTEDTRTLDIRMKPEIMNFAGTKRIWFLERTDADYNNVKPVVGDASSSPTITTTLIFSNFFIENNSVIFSVFDGERSSCELKNFWFVSDSPRDDGLGHGFDDVSFSNFFIRNNNTVKDVNITETVYNNDDSIAEVVVNNVFYNQGSSERTMDSIIRFDTLVVEENEILLGNENGEIKIMQVSCDSSSSLEMFTASETDFPNSAFTIKNVLLNNNILRATKQIQVYFFYITATGFRTVTFSNFQIRNNLLLYDPWDRCFAAPIARKIYVQQLWLYLIQGQSSSSDSTSHFELSDFLISNNTIVLSPTAVKGVEIDTKNFFLAQELSQFRSVSIARLQIEDFFVENFNFHDPRMNDGSILPVFSPTNGGSLPEVVQVAAANVAISSSSVSIKSAALLSNVDDDDEFRAVLSDFSIQNINIFTKSTEGRSTTIPAVNNGQTNSNGRLRIVNLAGVTQQGFRHTTIENLLIENVFTSPRFFKFYTDTDAENFVNMNAARNEGTAENSDSPVSSFTAKNFVIRNIHFATYSSKPVVYNFAFQTNAFKLTQITVVEFSNFAIHDSYLEGTTGVYVAQLYFSPSPSNTGGEITGSSPTNPPSSPSSPYYSPSSTTLPPSSPTICPYSRLTFKNISMNNLDINIDNAATATLMNFIMGKNNGVRTVDGFFSINFDQFYINSTKYTVLSEGNYEIFNVKFEGTKIRGPSDEDVPHSYFKNFWMSNFAIRSFHVQNNDDTGTASSNSVEQATKNNVLVNIASDYVVTSTLLFEYFDHAQVENLHIHDCVIKYSSGQASASATRHQVRNAVFGARIAGSSKVLSTGIQIPITLSFRDISISDIDIVTSTSFSAENVLFLNNFAQPLVTSFHHVLFSRITAQNINATAKMALTVCNVDNPFVMVPSSTFANRPLSTQLQQTDTSISSYLLRTRFSISDCVIRDVSLTSSADSTDTNRIHFTLMNFHIQSSISYFDTIEFSNALIQTVSINTSDSPRYPRIHNYMFQPDSAVTRGRSLLGSNSFNATLSFSDFRIDDFAVFGTSSSSSVSSVVNKIHVSNMYSTSTEWKQFQQVILENFAVQNCHRANLSSSSELVQVWNAAVSDTVEASSLDVTFHDPIQDPRRFIVRNFILSDFSTFVESKTEEVVLYNLELENKILGFDVVDVSGMTISRFTAPILADIWFAYVRNVFFRDDITASGILLFENEISPSSFSPSSSSLFNQFEGSVIRFSNFELSSIAMLRSKLSLVISCLSQTIKSGGGTTSHTISNSKAIVIEKMKIDRVMAVQLGNVNTGPSEYIFSPVVLAFGFGSSTSQLSFNGTELENGSPSQRYKTSITVSSIELSNSAFDSESTVLFSTGEALKLSVCSINQHPSSPISGWTAISFSQIHLRNFSSQTVEMKRKIRVLEIVPSPSSSSVSVFNADAASENNFYTVHTQLSISDIFAHRVRLTSIVTETTPSNLHYTHLHGVFVQAVDFMNYNKVLLKNIFVSDITLFVDVSDGLNLEFATSGLNIHSDFYSQRPTTSSQFMQDQPNSFAVSNIIVENISSILETSTTTANSAIMNMSAIIVRGENDLIGYQSISFERIKIHELNLSSSSSASRTNIINEIPATSLAYRNENLYFTGVEKSVLVSEVEITNIVVMKNGDGGGGETRILSITTEHFSSANMGELPAVYKNKLSFFDSANFENFITENLKLSLPTNSLTITQLHLPFGVLSKMNSFNVKRFTMSSLLFEGDPQAESVRLLSVSSFNDVENIRISDLKTSRITSRSSSSMMSFVGVETQLEDQQANNFTFENSHLETPSSLSEQLTFSALAFTTKSSSPSSASSNLDQIRIDNVTVIDYAILNSSSSSSSCTSQTCSLLFLSSSSQLSPGNIFIEDNNVIAQDHSSISLVLPEVSGDDFFAASSSSLLRFENNDIRSSLLSPLSSSTSSSAAQLPIFLLPPASSSDSGDNTFNGARIELHCNKWSRAVQRNLFTELKQRSDVVPVLKCEKTPTVTKAPTKTQEMSETNTFQNRTKTTSKGRSHSASDSAPTESHVTPSFSFPLPKPKLVKNAISQEVTALGMVMTALSGGANSMNARKIIAISSLADCGKEEIYDEDIPPVEPDSNPLFIRFGTARFDTYRGAIIGAVAFLVLWMVLMCFIGWVRAKIEKCSLRRALRKIGVPGTISVPGFCLLPASVNSAASMAKRYYPEEKLDMFLIVFSFVTGGLLPILGLLWIVKEVRAHEVLKPSNDVSDDDVDENGKLIIRKKSRNDELKKVFDDGEEVPKWKVWFDWLTEPKRDFKRSKFKDAYGPIFDGFTTPFFILFSYLLVIAAEVTEGAVSLCAKGDRACCESGLNLILVVAVLDFVSIICFSAATRAFVFLVRSDAVCVTICCIIGVVNSTLIIIQFQSPGVDHTDTLMLLTEIAFYVSMIGAGLAIINEVVGASYEIRTVINMRNRKKEVSQFERHLLFSANQNDFSLEEDGDDNMELLGTKNKKPNKSRTKEKEKHHTKPANRNGDKNRNKSGSDESQNNNNNTVEMLPMKDDTKKKTKKQTNENKRSSSVKKTDKIDKSSKKRILLLEDDISDLYLLSPRVAEKKETRHKDKTKTKTTMTKSSSSKR